VSRTRIPTRENSIPGGNDFSAIKRRHSPRQVGTTAAIECALFLEQLIIRQARGHKGLALLCSGSPKQASAGWLVGLTNAEGDLRAHSLHHAAGAASSQLSSSTRAHRNSSRASTHQATTLGIDVGDGALGLGREQSASCQEAPG